MDFNFTEEEAMLRTAFRDFANNEIVPLVKEAEEKEKFPQELFPKMGKLGYLCIWADEKYGGENMGVVPECILNEEFAYVNLGIAEISCSSHFDGALVIYRFGNEEQKMKYIPPSVRGELIGSIATTEPEAGSDVAAIKTRAVRDGNDYILNGSKIFITNGHNADYVSVLAYTDPDKGPKSGMSAFIVEKGMPGFSCSKIIPKVGMRSAEDPELVFEDCRVPKENLLGEEGMGFHMLMDILGSCRVNHAARSLGLARAAFDASLEYAKERITFGVPIARHQAIQFKLAEMATEINAMRWMVYNAAWLQDQGLPFRMETSMAKFYCASKVRNITREAVHIHGGYGLMMETPVQRFWRDSEFMAVTEGTLEMQLLTIGRQLIV